MTAQRFSLGHGRFLPRGQPVDARIGNLVQVESVNLDVDVTTAVGFPTYSTLLSGTITTALASSVLNILFYASFDVVGGAFGTRAVAPRLRVDGVLVPPSRAATDNNLTASNMNLALSRRVAVTAGLHTVVVEWTRFGGATTMRCLPVTLPDRHGAHLIIEEQRA